MTFNTINTMEFQEDKYRRAASRVKKIRKYYGSVITFILFTIIFICVNYYSNGLRYPWFLWIIGFWGLGIVIEGFKLFGLDLMLGRNWEKRRIEEEMRKEDDSYRF